MSNIRGRPRKEIDQKQFEAMCAIQATEEEICMVFNVSVNTLNKWCRKTYGNNFCKVFAQKKALGKMSLRRRQWDLAKRNATMAIFFGKQYLGQHDTDRIEVSGKDGEAIETKNTVQFYLPDNGRDKNE